MDLSHLEKVIQLLQKYELTEISYETKESTITLKKDPRPIISSLSNICSDQPTYAESYAPEENLRSTAPISSSAQHIVKAALVGTFYRATDPQSPPLVSIGQKVSKGDPIGLIEAMKVLSLISAPYDGIIEEILIDNGQVVQFEQPLFSLLPTEI